MSATSGNVTSHCTHLEVQHVGAGISFPLWTFHPHYCIIHITGLLVNGFLPPGSAYVNGRGFMEEEYHSRICVMWTDVTNEMAHNEWAQAK